MTFRIRQRLGERVATIIVTYSAKRTERGMRMIGTWRWLRMYSEAVPCRATACLSFGHVC